MILESPDGQCHPHFSFNRPVNMILERSVSKLYLMVYTFVKVVLDGVHFCQSCTWWCALLCNQLSIIHHKLLSCRCATGGKHPWALSGDGLLAKSEISADWIFSQPLCCSAVNFSWILFMEKTTWQGGRCIPDICHFFTQANFFENKICTEKTHELRQNTQKIANFLRYYGKIHSKFFALNL